MAATPSLISPGLYFGNSSAFSWSCFKAWGLFLKGIPISSQMYSNCWEDSFPTAPKLNFFAISKSGELHTTGDKFLIEVFGEKAAETIVVAEPVFPGLQPFANAATGFTELEEPIVNVGRDKEPPIKAAEEPGNAGNTGLEHTLDEHPLGSIG